MNVRRRIAVLITPPTLWLLALLVLPVGLMLLFTFRSGTFGEASRIFTLVHYQEFWQNASFHRLLLRSIYTAFLVSLYSIVLSYPVAYFLAFKAGPARITLLTVLIVPAWTSYLLRVLAWKIILGSSGILNSLLQSIGLINTSLPILLYNNTANIITLTYAWIPFVALPIFAALERIDRSLLEGAADLGAEPWEAFLRITLPLSLPGVVAGFLFVFIPTVGEYVTPALVGGTDVMYGNIIWDQFLRALNWPIGSLMSIAMLLAVLLPLFVLGRFIRLSELAGI